MASSALFTPEQLLPRDAANSKWSQVTPVADLDDVKNTTSLSQRPRPPPSSVQRLPDHICIKLHFVGGRRNDNGRPCCIVRVARVGSVAEADEIDRQVAEVYRGGDDDAGGASQIDNDGAATTTTPPAPAPGNCPVGGPLVLRDLTPSVEGRDNDDDELPSRFLALAEQWQAGISDVLRTDESSSAVSTACTEMLYYTGSSPILSSLLRDIEYKKWRDGVSLLPIAQGVYQVRFPPPSAATAGSVGSVATTWFEGPFLEFARARVTSCLEDFEDPMEGLGGGGAAEAAALCSGPPTSPVDVCDVILERRDILPQLKPISKLVSLESQTEIIEEQRQPRDEEGQQQDQKRVKRRTDFVLHDVDAQQHATISCCVLHRCHLLALVLAYAYVCTNLSAFETTDDDDDVSGTSGTPPVALAVAPHHRGVVVHNIPSSRRLSMAQVKCIAEQILSRPMTDIVMMPPWRRDDVTVTTNNNEEEGEGEEEQQQQQQQQQSEEDRRAAAERDYAIFQYVSWYAGSRSDSGREDDGIGSASDAAQCPAQVHGSLSMGGHKTAFFESVEFDAPTFCGWPPHDTPEPEEYGISTGDLCNDDNDGRAAEGCVCIFKNALNGRIHVQERQSAKGPGWKLNEMQCVDRTPLPPASAASSLSLTRGVVEHVNRYRVTDRSKQTCDAADHHGTSSLDDGDLMIAHALLGKLIASLRPDTTPTTPLEPSSLPLMHTEHEQFLLTQAYVEGHKDSCAELPAKAAVDNVAAYVSARHSRPSSVSRAQIPRDLVSLGVKKARKPRGFVYGLTPPPARNAVNECRRNKASCDLRPDPLIIPAPVSLWNNSSVVLDVSKTQA